jgi:hypothetical protein
MSVLTLLLPPADRLAGHALTDSVARALGRADRTVGGDAGERAQLLRHFELLPRGWPVAALTRQHDAVDAAHAAWVRADPVYIRPDINGARLLAHGPALQLGREDAQALLPALKPLFGDTGFPIDAPTPDRWYLRLPLGAKLPRFAEPADALGADVFDHLPEGDEGRRWRALLSEAQVVLHNHEWNARRVASGRPPVNSLWFWGGGVLPDHVRGAHAVVQSDDVLVHALASAAGTTPTPLPNALVPPDADTACDLRGLRDAQALQHEWLAPALAMLQARRLDALVLDFSDGTGFRLERGQRWRFWRRPRAAFA